MAHNYAKAYAYTNVGGTNSYLLPMYKQPNNAAWRTFCQAWVVYLDQEQEIYGPHTHNMQVLSWAATAQGVAISLVPTLPGGDQQHVVMVYGNNGSAYLVAR